MLIRIKCFLSYVSFKVSDILSSESCQYCVLELMGSGVYGQVAKCLNKTTKEIVAVKAFCNTGGIHEARREVQMGNTPVGSLSRVCCVLMHLLSLLLSCTS